MGIDISLVRLTPLDEWLLGTIIELDYKRLTFNFFPPLRFYLVFNLAFILILNLIGFPVGIGPFWANSWSRPNQSIEISDRNSAFMPMV